MTMNSAIKARITGTVESTARRVKRGLREQAQHLAEKMWPGKEIAEPDASIYPPGHKFPARACPARIKKFQARSDSPLLELALAVRNGSEPALNADEIAWARTAYIRRHIDEADVPAEYLPLRA